MSLSDRMSDLGGTARAGTLQDGIRPTGTEIFNQKSTREQDEMLGAKAAAAVRAGEIGLDELVEVSHLDSDQPDFITQKPVDSPGGENGR